MFIIFYYIYTNYYKKEDTDIKEKFDKVSQLDKSLQISNSSNETSSSILITFISLFISIYSSYLSYNCNYKGYNMDPISNLFFAIIAFLLGFLYLIYYFIFNYLFGKCS